VKSGLIKGQKSENLTSNMCIFPRVISRI